MASLSIKELKAALTRHGVSFAGCVEKGELVKLLQQVDTPVDMSIEPSAKRPRTETSIETSASTAIGASASTGASVSTAVATGASASTAIVNGSTHLERLLNVLPREDRRLKEPDPARLLEPHRVPAATSDLLRVCTLNMLDDGRVGLGMGGIHAVWDVRRINMLRVLLAIDADVFLLQELCEKSVAFIRATLSEYVLVPFLDRGESRTSAYDGRELQAAGVGVLYRARSRAASAGSARAVYLSPAGDAVRRVMRRPSADAAASARRASGGGRGGGRSSSSAGGRGLARDGPVGIAIHLPLLVHGLAGAAADATSAAADAVSAGAAAADASSFRFVASSTHLTYMVHGQLQSCNKLSRHFANCLGRDLLRLPALHGRPPCPMVLGGDYNAGGDGKRTRAGGGSLSLYGELTLPQRREHDSEDEWDEDEDADRTLPWPAAASERSLAADLWRDAKVRERDFGGLQRGSTCTSVHLQNFENRLQGVRARAASQGWADDGECTDEGHIDWLLQSAVHGEQAWPQLRARRAVVVTELVCPPLPPQQPSLVTGPTTQNNLPPGGAIFASDHYPVFCDLQVQARQRALR